MSFTPDVDDLRLVDATHRRGSIGAAARDLHLSQPAASARLAALERRLGVRLFDRDTTGARATDAGRAFAEEAGHILEHLALLPDRVRTGAVAPLLRVATFPSFAAAVFPALDRVLDEAQVDVGVHQYVDHGDTLVGLVAEGSMDIAVVGIAEQFPLPPAVTATPLGRDRLVMLRPAGAPAGRGRRPFRDHVVPYHCADLRGATLRQRIADLGGRPRLCATGEVAVLTARTAGCPALLAGSIAGLYRAPEETVEPAPFSMQFTFHLVTRTPPPGVVATIGRSLAVRMGLDPADTL